MKKQRMASTYGIVLVLGLAFVGGFNAVALNPNHQCLYCHQLHGATNDQLLKESVVETLCLTCHGPAGSSSLKVAVHSNKPEGSTHAAFNQTCIDCHTPHTELVNSVGGTNIMLVGENYDGTGIPKINTPNSGLQPVAFESRGTDASEPSLHSFADNDEDNNATYDGVCEVCHTTTAHHTNTGDVFDAGHATTGRTCVGCHPHSTGFIQEGSPTSGCTNCHNVAQGGRREVMSDFSLFSHHLADPPDEADCIICHDNTAHSAGGVVLFNVDDASTITLTGDPSTSSTEAAKLTDFCLACHDADGAAGNLKPFSDGVTRPLVDAATWQNVSTTHNVNSCFGDGSTFGCHGNGHGSLKKTLLAPPDVAPTGPDYPEEQEGFCYGCHDSDGPAAADVASAFAKTTRHRITGADQVGDGRDVECGSCHDKHYAKNGGHTVGNTVAGTTIEGVDGVDVSGSPVAQITYEYELCFKCHANYAGAGNNPGDGGPDPVADKTAQFDPAGTTFHPVRGAQDNSFCDASTMVAPWNQSGHDTMWCSDCHQDSAVKGPHGADTPGLLRASLSAVDTGDGFHTPLCVECHSYASYVTGSDGNFGSHDVGNHQQPDWAGGYGGCLSCHYGSDLSVMHGSSGLGSGDGTVPNAAFLNGTRVVSVVMGRRSPECLAVDSTDDSGCSAHTKTY